MQIKMIRAPHEKAVNAGSPQPKMVWWWRIREDNDDPIGDLVGWEFNRVDAYAKALRYLRDERTKREELSNGKAG